ncbi:MAG: DUF3305 domain-containing protein, partial [Aeromonas veronii]
VKATGPDGRERGSDGVTCAVNKAGNSAHE